MKIAAQIDLLIEELKKHNRKPEHIIMGRNIATKWLVEISREGHIEFHKVKNYRLNYKGIPIVVCESEILEVVPNSRYLLN